MKKMFLLMCIVAITVTSVRAFPVDENAFFLRPVNFSPESERHLDAKWLIKPAQVYPFAKAEIKKLNGIPWPFIEGKAVKSFSRSITQNQSSGHVERLMRENGIEVFILDVNVAQVTDPGSDGFTIDKTTFVKFERGMNVLLEAVPDAKVIIRFWLGNVPPDYLKKYPDAVLTGEDGKTDWGFAYNSVHNQRPNCLNEWRRYNGEFLYKFIAMTGQSRYAPHIAGFYLGAMSTGEWWFYKGLGDVGWDYSPGRKAAFKYYLNEKYGADHVEILKKLWGLNSADEVYRLPTMKERGVNPQYPCGKVAD